MPEATVTSKGQITIPADIRRALGLKTGERVVFTQLDDGTTVFRAKRRSIMEIRGILKPAQRKRRPVSIKDMNIGR
jgi:AbrB family looped-hinge helix DNA binding protein